MKTQKAARLMAMHMFFVGFQFLSVIVNANKGNAVMVVFSTVMAGFSGLCAYEFYCKLAEHPESAN